MSIRVGFLGAGNMAGALLSGLIRSKAVEPFDVRASDTSAERLAELSTKHGIETHLSNAELVRWANVIVLSVKPQVVPEVLLEC